MYSYIRIDLKQYLKICHNYIVQNDEINFKRSLPSNFEENMSCVCIRYKILVFLIILLFI